MAESTIGNDEPKLEKDYAEFTAGEKDCECSNKQDTDQYDIQFYCTEIKAFFYRIYDGNERH
jgi:hypothetical protein